MCVGEEGRNNRKKKDVKECGISKVNARGKTDGMTITDPSVSCQIPRGRTAKPVDGAAARIPLTNRRRPANGWRVQWRHASLPSVSRRRGKWMWLCAGLAARRCRCTRVGLLHPSLAAHPVSVPPFPTTALWSGAVCHRRTSWGSLPFFSSWARALAWMERRSGSNVWKYLVSVSLSRGYSWSVDYSVCSCCVLTMWLLS